MEPELARKAWRTLEPYHAFVYFSAQAAQNFAALGVDGQAGYFASRAAAMGPVTAPVVVATFFNFRPSLVEQAIPAAWAKASADAFIDARLTAVDVELRQMLGDGIDSPTLAEAAELASRAMDACTFEGRPLAGAHAAIPRPEEPHLALWHAVTVLREYRGDGHVAALVTEGFDACEALVSHAAAGPELPRVLLQATRGWTDEEWEAARARLEERGLVVGDDLTDAGRSARVRVEDDTDRRALAPWRAIGPEGVARLREVVRPLSKAIVASGAIGLPAR